MTLGESAAESIATRRIASNAVATSRAPCGGRTVDREAGENSRSESPRNARTVCFFGPYEVLNLRTGSRPCISISAGLSWAAGWLASGRMRG